VRETASRTAYSTDEYERIFNVLDPQIKFSKGLVIPYVRTGKGKDPRKVNKARLPPDKKVVGQGWNCWTPTGEANELAPSEDNLRWYFENVMKCAPLFHQFQKTENTKGFFKLQN
jgi:hypothetical protein